MLLLIFQNRFRLWLSFFFFLQTNLFLGALFHWVETVSAYDQFFFFFFSNKLIFGALSHWKKPFPIINRFFFFSNKLVFGGPTPLGDRLSHLIVEPTLVLKRTKKDLKLFSWRRQSLRILRSEKVRTKSLGHTKSQSYLITAWNKTIKIKTERHAKDTEGCSNTRTLMLIWSNERHIEDMLSLGLHWRVQLIFVLTSHILDQSWGTGSTPYTYNIYQSKIH
jgi:hypothetical protein